MYIYNVTTNIEEASNAKWLKWMKEIHIPEVLATGKFLSAKLCRVMIEEEMGGHTYSVQYAIKDKATLEKYYEEDAPRLRQEALKLFADKAVSFRTELEVISENHKTPLQSSEYLFTYGTLQEESIQFDVFGRQPQEANDTLLGYKISSEKVLGSYPVIKPSNQVSDTVEGKVYLVTPKELQMADRYEGDLYKRISVDLKSGKKAWVYIGK